MRKIHFVLVVAIAAIISSCSRDEIKEIEKVNNGLVREELDNSKIEENPSDNHNKEEEDKKPHTQKPADYTLATRAQAVWKEGASKYDIDFDRLYRLGEKDFITAEYLSKWVRYYSSDVDGTVYEFTDEDLKELTISDVSYSSYPSDAIRFKIKYRNISKEGWNSLEFSKQAYYEQKVKTVPAKGRFAYGSYKIALSGIYMNFISYDETKYIAEYKGNAAWNSSPNSISFSVLLIDRQTRKELAEFTKEIVGFDKVDVLKNNLELEPSYELNQYMGQKLRKKKDGDVSKFIKESIRNWQTKLKFIYHREDEKSSMAWDTLSEVRSQQQILVADKTNMAWIDVNFLDPHFEVVSAVKNGVFMDLKIRLTYVNEQPVEDAVYSLHIHLIGE